MKGISREQLQALEADVEADAAAPRFAALAEVHRRAGRLADAERVARQGLDRKPESSDGRLVLSLALLDQGRIAEARDELERLATALLASHGISSPATASGSLSEDELDHAFAEAETDADELIDPNRVAAAAVAHVDGAAEEDLEEEEPSAALEPGSAFATATMAALLERQGDEGGAERIRAALQPGPASSTPASPAASADDARRQQWIGTLERWLDNLRGDRP